MTSYVLVALFSFLSGGAVVGFIVYRWGAKAEKVVQAVEGTQTKP